MVLKKPYAFIIKHFRAIHLLLLIPMFYILLKTGNIVGFFRDYCANGFIIRSSEVLSSLTSNYINIFMYIALIVVLGVYSTLSIVLQLKEKPTKFYNISVLYYILLLALLTASFATFNMIENDTMQNTIALIIRDISIIVYYSEFIFIALTFIRGIGFNIKQFNFKNDLADLQISEEDSEEFEFLVGKDSYVVKRNIRRFFRELKYYYKENKFIFTIIFIVIFLILANIIYTNRAVYQKVYKENESLSFGNLNLTVLDSYITNLDLNGKTINKDKTYLVLKIKIHNRYREDQSFNFQNVQFVTKNTSISPNLNLGIYFQDLGNPYTGANIKGNTDYSYILVYELNKDLLNKKYKIEAFSGFNNSKKNSGLITKKINVKPSTINNNISETNINAGTIANLGKTNLNNSSIAITKYELTNNFSYTYSYCLKSDCYNLTGGVNLSTSELDRLTFMVLDYNLVLDEKSNYMYSNKDYKTFFEDFGEIKYVLNNKTYTSDIVVSNPANYSDRLILKINRNISNASEIYVVITIRNVRYNIKLK